MDESTCRHATGRGIRSSRLDEVRILRVSFLNLLIMTFGLWACAHGPDQSAQDSKLESKPEIKLYINEELAVRELVPNTYLVTDKTYHNSNVLVARMKNGTVVIASSPFETESAKALVEWIKHELKAVKIIAIN